MCSPMTQMLQMVSPSHVFLHSTQHIHLRKALLVAARCLGGGGCGWKSGLTSAVLLGDQEQQDHSALGCPGCQPYPGSAAPGAAEGGPAGLCQYEGRTQAEICGWFEIRLQGAGEHWGPVNCGCAGDNMWGVKGLCIL